MNCPYLHYEASHCAGCTGWHCYVFGRKKRLSDTSMCANEDEWVECPRYLKKVAPTDPDGIPTVQLRGIGVLGAPRVRGAPRMRRPPLPADDCPYLGPVPTGEKACCGYWCYSTGGPIRSVKACHSRPSWRECKFLFQGQRRKVKPYAGP